MSGIVGSKLNIRGSGRVAKLGTDGQVLTSAGAGVSAVYEDAAGGGGGKIGQIVSTNKTDTWSESVGAGSFSSIVTGLTVAITPSDASSKILILLNATIAVSSGQSMGFGLFRDATQIDLGDASSSRPRMSKGKTAAPGSTYVSMFSTNYLDSPSSDSELVYGVKSHCTSSLTKTHYVNRGNDDTDNAYTAGRCTSTITAMEVLA